MPPCGRLEADLAATLQGEDARSEDPATMALTTERLTHDYPRHATSLLNLVKMPSESSGACNGPNKGSRQTHQKPKRCAEPFSVSIKTAAPAGGGGLAVYFLINALRQLGQTNLP